MAYTECQSRVVGDEFHLLFQCTESKIQSAKRELFLAISHINNQFLVMNEMCKFKYLITCADVDITTMLANFLNILNV